MADPDNPPLLEVTPAEAGQKLLQFLTRRMNLPQPLLHRWIRTGQIRLNKGRAKPFARVAAHDLVRLPPFAPSMAASAADQPPMPERAHNTSAPPPLPPLVAQTASLLVFNKPAGLPTHGGTGHSDSLADRLAVHYPAADFRPTPAHRLDKDTSGLLLVAASYATLRDLQDALQTRELAKEYLCWIEGTWERDGPVRLEHAMAKRYTGWEERVEIGEGKDAVCIAACLRRTGDRSLMQIRLLTGRTHQIRAQLAACGHPLCGDVKYGGTSRNSIRLHAARLVLPDGTCFEALPPWEGPDAVDALPPPLTDAAPILPYPGTPTPSAGRIPGMFSN